MNRWSDTEEEDTNHETHGNHESGNRKLRFIHYPIVDYNAHDYLRVFSVFRS